MKLASLPLLILFLTVTATSQPLPKPKNIIIMIGDGMGYNHILAADYYFGKKQSYENFPVKMAMATYPAKAGKYDPRDPSANYIATGYNPSLAWKDTAYLKRDFTESAASATAISTGVKTYNNSLGMSVNHDTLVNLTELAKKLGKSAGVVTTVPFCHATPAGFVVHNSGRGDYSHIAYEMILSSCDVIMGCGNPQFDNDGNPVKGKWLTNYAGDSIFWSDLVKGSGHNTSVLIGKDAFQLKDCNGDGKPDPWTIIQNKHDFENITTGKTPPRVLGCAEVYSATQIARKALNGEDKNSLPFVTPLISTVPGLSEMTKGAINVLDNNPKGFFIMIEGGAIDWANHSNLKGRMIEELYDFDKAVRAVYDWVEKNSNWDETLLIVTGDHETGLLGGDEGFFSPLKDNGKGNLPGMTYYSTNHTNSLIAVYAKGSGSEWLRQYADEYDSVRGQFIQNSEIAQLIHFLWSDH